MSLVWTYTQIPRLNPQLLMLLMSERSQASQAVQMNFRLELAVQIRQGDLEYFGCWLHQAHPATDLAS